MNPFMLFVIVLSFVLSGCLGLQTRRDVGSKASSEEREMAQKNLRDDELAQGIRELTGKVESLEYKINQAGGADSKNIERSHQRIDVLEERLKNIELSISSLEQKLKVSSTASSKTSTKKKGIFEQAQELFKKKKWQEAILEFNKYRETYPKGRRYADATYNIAVCFQELKQVEDAKAFFQEVVENFPKTKAAKRSKYRLNQLK